MSRIIRAVCLKQDLSHTNYTEKENFGEDSQAEMFYPY